MTNEQAYRMQREGFFASLNAGVGQGPKAADEVVRAHKAAYGSTTTAVGKLLQTGGNVTKVSKAAGDSYRFDVLMTKCADLMRQGRHKEASAILGGRAMKHIQRYGYGRY